MRLEALSGHEIACYVSVDFIGEHTQAESTLSPASRMPRHLQHRICGSKEGKHISEEAVRRVRQEVFL